ncbi:MAG TPA: arsenite methyltransferase [Dehalococcoidales bacterium]
MQDEEIRQKVREGYAKVATQSSSCCGSEAKTASAGCGCNSSSISPKTLSQQIGYSEEEMDEVPEGANLGLGCGNPVALASLKPGEVVLDLGSGAGFDCFLAASKVGPTGRVIGVDMTSEMLDKARANLRKGQYSNVEFRLGEIENLPVADNTVDAIISNCVINLSPDKKRVFREALRVLKPAGRLMVSDIVVLKELPQNIKDSIAAYVGCIAGASVKNDYLAAIKAAGFQDIQVVGESFYPIDGIENDSTVKQMMDDSGVTLEQLKDMAASVSSIKVSAFKPAN